MHARYTLSTPGNPSPRALSRMSEALKAATYVVEQSTDRTTILFRDIEELGLKVPGLTYLY
jgi:hypothetical protein